MTAQGWGVTPQAKCFTYRQVIDIMGNSFHAVSCAMAFLAALATAGYDDSWRDSHISSEPSPPSCDEADAEEEDEEEAPGQALGSGGVEVQPAVFLPEGQEVQDLGTERGPHQRLQDSPMAGVQRNLADILASVNNSADTDVLVPQGEIERRRFKWMPKGPFSLDAQPSKRIPVGLRGFLADEEVVSPDGGLVLSPVQSAAEVGDRTVIDLD